MLDGKEVENMLNCRIERVIIIIITLKYLVSLIIKDKFLNNTFKKFYNFRYKK